MPAIAFFAIGAVVGIVWIFCGLLAVRYAAHADYVRNDTRFWRLTKPERVMCLCLGFLLLIDGPIGFFAAWLIYRMPLREGLLGQ